MKTVLNIKPLSVNNCRQWRRFKTKNYLQYEKELLLKLPQRIIDDWLPLIVTITYWFSNIGADIDNPSKPLLDILQKKYWFDDKWIFEKHEYKLLVSKWHEFIKLEIDYCEYNIKSVKERGKKEVAISNL